MTEAVALRDVSLPPKLTDEAIAAVAANIRQFEKFKQSVLGPKDFTYMGDNQYIEKSGWVKMRMAMNANFEILDDGRRIVARDDEGEYYTWIFKGRAVTPGGVSVQMDGACSSRDEFFSMKRDETGESVRRKSSEIDEKDIIATAQTNCFVRCMSFLCGFGELGADEVRGKQFAKKPVVFPFGDLKGQAPSDVDLAMLQRALPFWERQAADPQSKFADANKRLVAAIKEAIAEKTASVTTSPAAPATQPVKAEGTESPPAPAGDVSKPMTDLEKAWIEARELMEAAEWTEGKLTVWARKTKGVGPKELDVLGVQALCAHLRSVG